MTDTELFEIVKGHREAWPEGMTWQHIGLGIECFVIDGGISTETCVLAFEASFHRSILKYTYCMRVEDHKDQIYVIVKHHQFEAPTLIEAYARALEWLK